MQVFTNLHVNKDETIEVTINGVKQVFTGAEFEKFLNDLERLMVDTDKEFKEFQAKYIACLEKTETLSEERDMLLQENKDLKKELENYIERAKEEIRKQREEDAIRWTNIGR